MRTLAVFVVALAVLSAQPGRATIIVNWVAFLGVDDPAVPGTSADLPSGSLVQLIWSPDASPDPLDPLDPTTPQGNDILLDEQITLLVGSYSYLGTFRGEDFGQGPDGLVPGYVYQRIFDSGTPGAGTWHAEAGLIGGPLTDQDVLPLVPDVSDAAMLSTLTLDQQIVPEPAAAVLFGGGLALLVAGARRTSRVRRGARP
jgi:hypothetical protein